MLAVITIAILFSHCGKDEPPVVVSKKVSITAIAPPEGAGGTRVTIKGANFNATAAGNLVLFHTDTAVVSAAFADSLVVVAPLHGTTGPVSVTVAGETAIGPVFTYTVDTTGTADTTHPVQDSVDIYAAGYDNQPIYWTGGTEYLLVHRAYASYSSAYALALVDTDVYIAGTDDTKAKYWKNGTETVLSNPNYQGGEARSLVVAGSDIYIGGSDYYHPVYWKNGVETNLSGNEGIVNGMSLYNGDVYAVGRLGDTAIMWKNGVATHLSTVNADDVTATGIAFMGSDVYVCGAENGNAVLWKNGVETILASPPADRVGCKAYAVAVAGNNTFVVGNDGSDAVYWLNGTEEKLTHGGYLSVATAITFYNNDVYIAGFDGSAPVYWKNGVRYIFPSGIASAAYTIAVVKHR